MYEGNPRQIDFSSSWREVRVSEGSSFRESIVPPSRLDLVLLQALGNEECRKGLLFYTANQHQRLKTCNTLRNVEINSLL